HRRRPRDPGPTLHVRTAHPGPGGRRCRRPRRPRASRRLTDHHGCRRRRPHPVHCCAVNHPEDLEISPSMTVPVSRGSNPLRDPDDRRLNRIAGPSALVIFGVTGDLSRKKLMPAVYDLANRGLLPPGFALVGFARRDWEDQDFAQVVYEAVKEHARTEFREETWKQLLQGIRFVSGEFDNPDSFVKLRDTVEKLDIERGTMGNHAYYLSIPPKSFPLVAKQLKESGLVGDDDDDECWRRVVIEKPFGHDLESARALNEALEVAFPADAIFRIDHYLGKETVQNILALRFANALYEPI